jgi:YVTN family beta-propeller protein
MLLLILAGSYGCGSKGNVVVTISPTTDTVTLGQCVQFTAVVTGNSNTSVTWSVNNVTGGNSSTGTVTTQGDYCAPVNALNAATVNVTATSVANTAVSATATVTISSGAVVTVFPINGPTIAAGASFQFTDTVTNTINPNQPTAVNWYVNSVENGTPTTGSISNTGYYTAPAKVSSATNYVIEAILQADSTSHGSTTVTVVPPGAATLSQVFPSTIAQGALFENVYLYGSDFLSTSIARVNTNAVPTTFISTNVLLATVPGSDLGPSNPPNTDGTLFVDVLQQSGGSPSAAVDVLTMPAAPTLIGTTPDSIPYTSIAGGPIEIGFDGGYFIPSTSAEINGQTASASLQSNNNNRQLNVTAIPSAVGVTSGGLYSVNVRNPGVPGQIAARNLAVEPGGSPSILTTYAVGATPTSVAVNTATGIALVANSGANSISAFNLAAFLTTPQGNPQLPTTTVGTTGSSPTCVAIDNIRNLAFVVNNGTAATTIQILDLSPLTAATPAPANIITTISNTATTPLNEFPYSIGVNSVTGQALVVYQNSSATTFINYASSTSNPTVITDTIQSQIATTGLSPQIAVEPKLDWALVTPGGSGGTGSMAIVDLNGNGTEVVSDIAPPSSNGAVRSDDIVTITTLGAHGLSLNETVVIAGVSDTSFDGTFTVASVPSTTTFTYAQTGPNTSTGAGNGTVSAAAPLVPLSVDPNVRGIAVNPETETAVLTDPAASSLTIFSLLDQTTTSPNSTTLNVGEGYSAVAVNPLTNIAVAVTSNGNQAVLIDLQRQQVLGSSFTVGNNPTAVAIDPVTNIALVVNQNDNTVTFIQLGQIRSTLTTPQPQIVDISSFSTLTSTTPLTITVIGAGFTGNSLVRLSETPLATTYVGSRELTATIPSTLLSSPIRYVLDVQNSDGTVSNVKDFTVMQAVTVGTSPEGVAIVSLDPPQGGANNLLDYAVVTNTGSNSVTVIDLSDMSIKGTVGVGKSPIGVAASSVYGRAAVADNQDDTVYIIDLYNIAVSGQVSVAPSSSSGFKTSQPIGIAVNPASGQTIVADSNSKQISSFNIQAPGTPTTLTLDVGPNAVAIDPFQNIAAVTEGASNAVVIVNLADLQILNRQGGFSLPTGVIYEADSPDPGTFLVTSSLANSIITVTADVATGSYQINTPVPVGINPTALDYNYRSSTLVTANTMSQTLSVMDFLTNTVKAVIPISVSQQFGVAIDPLTNRAVVVDQNHNRVLIVPLPF